MKLQQSLALLLFIITITSSNALECQVATLTITVTTAKKKEADPAFSTVQAYPLHLSICKIRRKQSIITVIPRDKNGSLLESGQKVRIYTTAGRLLDTIKDHGNGVYTQALTPLLKVGIAAITAEVNGIPLNQHPKVYFTNRTPATIFIVSGDRQKGIINTTLDNPLIVKVIDARGNPVYGAPVIFAADKGGGSICSGKPITTDRRGLASAILTLGPEPGKNTATSSFYPFEPLTFTAIGRSPLIRAVWVYDIEEISTEKQKQILEELKDLGINLIYLDLESENSFLLDTIKISNSVNEFVNLAERANIQVEGMILQDPNWIDLFDPWGGDLRSDEVIRRVNKVIYSDIPFTGIHIDVQPHKHREWAYYQWKENNELILRLQILLSLIKDTISISETNISFSATVAWWYNNAADFGFLQEGDAALLSYPVDYLVPLIPIFKNKYLLREYREQRGRRTIERGGTRMTQIQEGFNREIIKFDNLGVTTRLYGHRVYSCVIDEIKKLESMDGKGIVVGIINQKKISGEKILSLDEYLNKKLYPYDSYLGIAIRGFNLGGP